MRVESWEITAESQRRRVKRGLEPNMVRLSEKYRENSHGVSRFFTFYHQDQGRGLASQARHEMGAQKSCSLARNVVAIIRIVTGGTDF